MTKQERLDIFKNSKLYLVTSQEFSSYSTLYVVKESLEAGIKLFQMREKLMDDKSRLKLARKLKELSVQYNAVFIVNDDPYLAREVDADGIHLGQEDTDPILAREIVGEDKIIGLSTHNYSEAMQALTLPIDYINIGPVFSTNTKKHLKSVSLAEIKKITKEITIPFTFMGGIKANNLGTLLQFKPSSLAMVTEITMAGSVKDKVKSLFKLFNS